VNSGMHLVAMIYLVSSCTGRSWSSKVEHALRGRDQLDSEMHSQPAPGCDHKILEMLLEAKNR